MRLILKLVVYVLSNTFVFGVLFWASNKADQKLFLVFGFSLVISFLIFSYIFSDEKKDERKVIASLNKKY